jgi:hypothetical protein
MSEKDAASERVRVVPGAPAEQPSYRYQCYQGSSGSASEKKAPMREKKFAALRNFVLNVH